MIQLLRADARSIPLADASVDCVVTSPPYWGLRNYQVAGQIGLEKLHDCLGWARGSECDECHVCTQRRVFREVHRVLKPSGTLWLNYGDCYATGAGKVRTAPGGGKQGRAAREKYWGKHAAIGLPPMTQPNRLPLPGLKPKDLCGMAWRLAFALQADGWWLRSDIVWCKPNPMPESVTDRPTKAHEYLFLLSKAERYHFDQASWLEPASPGTHARLAQDIASQHGSSRANGGMKTNGAMKAVRRAQEHNNSRIARAAAHHKSAPTAERNGIRKRAAEGSGIKNNGSMDAALAIMPIERNRRTVWTINSDRTSEAHFATFPEALVEPCILAGCPKGGTVLDPFSGSGTTLAVANRLGRNGIGLELSAEYIEIARRRIFGDVTPTKAERASGQRLLLETQ
jgi:DNA modification methylase